MTTSIQPPKIFKTVLKAGQGPSGPAGTGEPGEQGPPGVTGQINTNWAFVRSYATQSGILGNPARPFSTIADAIAANATWFDLESGIYSISVSPTSDSVYRFRGEIDAFVSMELVAATGSDAKFSVLSDGNVGWNGLTINGQIGSTGVTGGTDETGGTGGKGKRIDVVLHGLVGYSGATATIVGGTGGTGGVGGLDASEEVGYDGGQGGDGGDVDVESSGCRGFNYTVNYGAPGPGGAGGEGSISSGAQGPNGTNPGSVNHHGPDTTARNNVGSLGLADLTRNNWSVISVDDAVVNFGADSLTVGGNNVLVNVNFTTNFWSFVTTPNSATLATLVGVGSSGAFVRAGSLGALATASSVAISTGVSGLGTGVANFLATPTRANFNTALSDADIAILGSNTFTDKQSFSGTNHVGLCLNSLTTAQYAFLTRTNGDSYIDTTLQRQMMRINGADRQVIDSSGGQIISGTIELISSNSSQTILLRNVAAARGAFLRYNDASGTFQFGRTDHSTTGSFTINSTSVELVGMTGRVAQHSAGVSIASAEAGGSNAIDLGRRLSDSSTAVGAEVRCWPTTSQTTPALSVVAPGGATRDFQVFRGGAIETNATLKLGVYTLSALTTAFPAASNARARTWISDCTLPYTSANIGTTATGGGSNLTPLFSNGTNWVIG